MSYLEKLLGANEKILARTRKHVFVLFARLFRETLILIVLTIGLLALQTREFEEKILFQLGFAAVMAVVAVSVLIDMLRWQNEEFVVTTRRVIHSSGILNKKILDSSLTKINDVVLNQSWLGRIFGYGTINILTASDEVVNLLERISRPLEFKQAMLNAKENLEVPAAPAPAASSPTQLLEELSQLKARNMISEEEYQEKRKEILKRI
jgi:uncharacterized membrane protein YdbT with pleckstrin-like domain